MNKEFKSKAKPQNISDNKKPSKVDHEVKKSEKVQEAKKVETKSEETLGDMRKPAASEIYSTVISVRRVSNVTKFGRVMSFSILVVCGDKKGKVGYGLGKSKELIDAKNKALNNAKRNMISINLFENRTIFHDQEGFSGATKVLVRKAKPGTGLIAGFIIRALCSHAGIQDIVSKCLGSKTSHNVVRAGLRALEAVNSYSDIAYRRGIHLGDKAKKPVA